LFFEVFALPLEACGGGLEGSVFVVGGLVFDHSVDDSSHFVRGGGEAFGFSESSSHAPGVLRHFVFPPVEPEHSEPQRARESAGHFARFGFEHLASADSVVGAEPHPCAKGFGAAKGFE